MNNLKCTPKRMAKIESRLKDIRDNKWRYDNHGHVEYMTGKNYGRVSGQVCQVSTLPDQNGPFIAESPRMIFDLLAEVKRLQAENNKFRRKIIRMNENKDLR